MMQLSTHLRCTAASGAQALHLVGAVPTCGNLPSRKRNKDGAKKLALTARDAKQALPQRARPRGVWRARPIGESSASCVLVTRASQLHRRVLAVSTRKGEARQGETIQGFSLTSHIDDAAQNVLAFPWQSDGGPARMAANCVFFQAARCNL